jgi:energy-coupling factor transport system permease protein
VTRFATSAWLVWFASAAALVFALQNPFATLAALAALVVVGATCARRGPEGASWTLMLKIGLAALVARVVLFGLTGHPGDTTLLTVPRIGAPAWLGGFSIGGRVTAEVVGEHAAEGLRITALLVSGGVFLSAVEVHRVLRMLPRFLFEFGLVVGIGIAFVPMMLRSAADIRDAQRVRGHRIRGVRGLRPLILPVLATALERSLLLAESMEARGYGRTTGEASRREARARAAIFVALLAIAGGGALLLAGETLAGAALFVPGATALGGALLRMSRAVHRTRHRPERMRAHDVALIASSVAAAAWALGARALDAAHWNAHPAIAWPSLDARVVAVPFALLAPVVIGAFASARVRRASIDADAREAPAPAPARASVGAAS